MDFMKEKYNVMQMAGGELWFLVKDFRSKRVKRVSNQIRKNLLVVSPHKGVC